MNGGDWQIIRCQNIKREERNIIMLKKLRSLIGRKREVSQSPGSAIAKERVWLTKCNIRTFIDIGAYAGEYIDYAQVWFPGCAIYAFEPLNDCYRNLVEKTKDMKNVNVYNYALGDKNGSSVIYRSSYAPSSSLLPMGDLHKKAFPFTSGSSKEQVHVRTLDSVFAGIRLEPNIFIKIDTQGYEDKIIKGGKKVIRQASIIQIEVSFHTLYKGQLLFHDIYSQLYAMGFSLSGFHNQILSPVDGSVLQAHAYFVNRNT